MAGRCMCGAVRYELSRAPLWLYNCHCGKCRHASGAAFVTNAIVPAESLAFTQGADRIRSWESSPGKRRFFCGDCGSPLYSHGAATAHIVSVRTGTLDGDIGLRPAYHAYAADALPWSIADDGLPRFDAMPDKDFIAALSAAARLKTG